MDVGRKDDKSKLRWDLLPIECVEDVVKVLTMGASKYAPNNWQLVENANERYYAALLRHLSAWRQGESVDPESGLNHLAHVMCNITFLLWFEKEKEKAKERKAQQANVATSGHTTYQPLAGTGTGAPYVGNGYTNVS